MENQKSAIGLDGNLAAAIGYPIGIIALILIFIEKDNKFVRFHAIQSIIWGVFIAIVLTVIGVVGGGLGLLSGWVIGSSTIALIFWGLAVLIVIIVMFAWFILFIMAAIKAYGGQRYMLPVVGKFAEKWSS